VAFTQFQEKACRVLPAVAVTSRNTKQWKWSTSMLCSNICHVNRKPHTSKSYTCL